MKVAMRPIESHYISNKEKSKGIDFIHAPTPSEIAQTTPDSFIRFWSFMNLDISGLPSLVETALNKGKKKLESFLPPLMWISKQGHGGLGAICYLMNLKKEDLLEKREYIDTEKWRKYVFGKDRGVVARISWGIRGDPPEKGVSLSQLERIHIGAYGFRDFLLVGGMPEGQLSGKGNCLSEEVYVSLRWVKNKREWVFDNPYENFGASETRTTWMMLKKGDSMIENYLKESKILIEFPEGLNHFGQSLMRKKGDYNCHETTHSGYNPVLNFLSQFGDFRKKNSIVKMNPDEGVEYLIEKVIPAVINFTKYQ